MSHFIYFSNPNAPVSSDVISSLQKANTSDSSDDFSDDDANTESSEGNDSDAFSD